MGGAVGWGRKGGREGGGEVKKGDGGRAALALKQTNRGRKPISQNPIIRGRERARPGPGGLDLPNDDEEAEEEAEEEEVLVEAAAAVEAAAVGASSAIRSCFSFLVVVLCAFL